MKKLLIEEKNISYVIAGKGPVLLFLHGFAESHLIWEQQIRYFSSNGYTVIAPDLPGFGASDVWPEISIPVYAEVVQQMLLHENAVPCSVFGHSMGGYIALSIAAQYPSLVSALGIIHSHPFADSSERIEARHKSVSFIRQYGLSPYLKQLYPSFFPAGYPLEHPDVLAKLIHPSQDFDADGVCAALLAMAKREDASDVLRNFSGSVLFILGQDDALVPANEQMLSQTTMPVHATVCLLDGVGHMSMFEAPEQLHHFLDTFIHTL